MEPITLLQLTELKSKLLQEDSTENNDEFEDRDNAMFLGSDPTNTNHEVYKSLNYEKTQKLLELKDGLSVSDSDSSGVLNDENMNVSNGNGCSSLNLATFGLSSSSATTSNHVDPTGYQPQQDPYLVSNVEDESCNIYLVDQAPNLCWYFRDHMN